MELQQTAPVILTLNESSEVSEEVSSSGSDWSEGEYLVSYTAYDACGSEKTDFFPVSVSTEPANYCPNGGADESL